MYAYYQNSHNFQSPDDFSLEPGTIIDMNIDEIPATHLDEQDVQSIIGDLTNQSTIGDETKIIDIGCLTAQFPSNEEIEALVFKDTSARFT